MQRGRAPGHYRRRKMEKPDKRRQAFSVVALAYQRRPQLMGGMLIYAFYFHASAF